MIPMSNKSEIMFILLMGVISIGSYVYVLRFETPGHVSGWGFIALGVGNAALLSLLAYLINKLYQGYIQKQESNETKSE